MAAASAAAVEAGGNELVARTEAHYSRGEFGEVVELLAGAELQILPGEERARILERLAGALAQLGRYDEALATADRAERDARAVDDPRMVARLELVRGTVARDRGHALDAVARFEAALALAERARAPELVSQALALLATSYQILGEWSRVLDLTERAFAADPHPSDAARARYLAQRGIAFYEFGDRDRAEGSFRESLALAEATGDWRAQSLAHGELGLVAWSFDRDAAAALAAYDRAIALARRSGVPSLEATWLINAGSVLRDTGDPVQATERYRAGLAIADSLALERQRAILLKNLGQVLSARGELEAAEPLLRQSLEDADRLRIPKIQWQARMELGELYRRRDPERARAYFEASLDLLEANQAGVLLEQLQVDLLGRELEQYDPYERLIDLLVSRAESAAAFEVAERGRARVFLASLARMRSAIASEVPADYLRAEREALARISTAQAALRAPDLAGTDRREQTAAVEREEEALAVLRARLARERPSLAHDRYPELTDLARLRQEVVGDDEAVLAYFLGRARSWVWVVTRRSASVVELPARHEIARRVNELRAELGRPDGAFDRAAGDAAWQALLAPVAARLPVGGHLVVVPHGVLHYLPFEALPMPDGRYLVESHTVSYAPSVASLAYLRATAPAGAALRRVLGIGNPQAASSGEASQRETQLALIGLLKPLPHTAAELRRLERVFGRAADVLEGQAATEASLRGALPGEVDILHFATHALVDERWPERSGLALTARPPDDGILQMREVYGLRLGAALVTLSACETALGRDVAGEGLVGLTRAFFHAGAGAVAATLWSVDDEAASELMGRFYAEIGRGRSLDRALADAKRSFLREGGRTAHPYYWAPYVLVGNGAASLRGRREWGPAVGLLLAAALLVTLGFTVRSRRRTAANVTR